MVVRERVLLNSIGIVNRKTIKLSDSKSIWVSLRLAATKVWQTPLCTGHWTHYIRLTAITSTVRCSSSAYDILLASRIVNRLQ
jgi:hypothetical protein